MHQRLVLSYRCCPPHLAQPCVRVPYLISAKAHLCLLQASQLSFRCTGCHRDRDDWVACLTEWWRRSCKHIEPECCYCHCRHVDDGGHPDVWTAEAFRTLSRSNQLVKGKVQDLRSFR